VHLAQESLPAGVQADLEKGLTVVAPLTVQVPVKPLVVRLLCG
jgi:hypothetical protein